MILGRSKYGKVRLEASFCARCGGVAAAIRWTEERKAEIKRPEFESVGVLQPSEPRVYASPVEEVLDHMQCEGEGWHVEVQALCGHTHYWATRVLGIHAEHVEEEPGSDEADGFVSPADMPEVHGHLERP